MFRKEKLAYFELAGLVMYLAFTRIYLFLFSYSFRTHLENYYFTMLFCI